MQTINYFKAAGISKKKLTSNIREELFAFLRQIIAYQMRLDGLKLKKIAKELGYADHTTPIYSINKIKHLVQRNDPTTAKLLDYYQFRLELYKSRR